MAQTILPTEEVAYRNIRQVFPAWAWQVVEADNDNPNLSVYKVRSKVEPSVEGTIPVLSNTDDPEVGLHSAMQLHNAFMRSIKKGNYSVRQG